MLFDFSEEQTEIIMNSRPLIATPCYGGMLHDSFFLSMFETSGICGQIGLPLHVRSISGESLITRARNELVGLFIEQDFSHLFFIDADIEFKPYDFFKLIAHDQDVVTASYPIKVVNWSGIKPSTCLSYEDFQRHTAVYVSNVKPDSITNGANKTLWEVHDAGTGFMCIKRHVIEKMIEAYPETAYKSVQTYPGLPVKEVRRWALFDTEIDDNGRYLSEDYTFCRRWQKLGGQVWLDPDVSLNHTGTYIYDGYPVFK